MKAKIKKKLEDLTNDALLILGDKLQSEDENVQLRAAKEVLDRSLPVKREIKQNGGGPVINIDISKIAAGLRDVQEIKGEIADA